MQTEYSLLGLAWVLHQGPDIIAIPGTTNVAHLEEDLAATTIWLTTDDLTRIEQRVPAPADDRYDPAGMRGVNL